MDYFKDTKNRPAAALLERETKRNQSRGNARDSNPLRSRSQRNDRDLVSGPLWGFALVVALVVTATLMAQPRLDPLQKMLAYVRFGDVISGFSTNGVTVTR